MNYGSRRYRKSRLTIPALLTLVIFSFILKARMALTVRTAKMARMVPMVLTARTANPPTNFGRNMSLPESMILTILEVNGIKPRHRWWISIGSLRETMARMDLSHISRMETGGLEIMTPESKPKVTRATKVIPEIKVIRVIKEILEPKEIRVIKETKETKETKAIKVIRAIPVFPAKMELTARARTKCGKDTFKKRLPPEAKWLIRTEMKSHWTIFPFRNSSNI